MFKALKKQDKTIKPAFNTSIEKEKEASKMLRSFDWFYKMNLTNKSSI